MKQTIDLNDFREAFRRMDRERNFSYNGLEALYELCEEINPDMELDVIALCCDFEEGEPEYFIEAYELRSIDELYEHTLAIDVENSTSIIIQNF